VKCARACNRCNAVPNGPGSVSVYAPGSSGNAVPTATIGGPNTGLKFPYEIAVDSNGNIYVMNATHLGFAFFCVGKGSKSADTRHGVQKDVDRTSGPVLIFAAGSNGDVPPIGTIGGPFTGLDFGSSGIANRPGRTLVRQGPDAGSLLQMGGGLGWRTICRADDRCAAFESKNFRIKGPPAAARRRASASPHGRGRQFNSNQVQTAPSATSSSRSFLPRPSNSPRT